MYTGKRKCRVSDSSTGIYVTIHDVNPKFVNPISDEDMSGASEVEKRVSAKQVKVKRSPVAGGAVGSNTQRAMKKHVPRSALDETLQYLAVTERDAQILRGAERSDAFRDVLKVSFSACADRFVLD